METSFVFTPAMVWGATITSIVIAIVLGKVVTQVFGKPAYDNKQLYIIIPKQDKFEHACNGKTFLTDTEAYRYIQFIIDGTTATSRDFFITEQV